MSSNPQITIGVLATDRARSVLQQVDQKVKQTTQVVSTESQKMANSSQQMAGKFKQNFSSIAQSVAGLGAGITSFAFSFGSIETAQLSAQTAQLTYEKSLQRLEKLQAGGKATTEQLSIAQAEVALNSSKMAEAQDNVTESYTQFLAQVPSQIISFGVAGSAIMKTLGLSHGQAAAGAAGQAGATNLLSASLWRSVGAAVAARAAMIAAFIATPVGAVILGVTTLITLLVFNVGGIRDAFFNAGKAIHEFINVYFKPLGDLITWVIDGLNALGAGLNTGVTPAYGEASAATGEFTNETISAGHAIAGTTKELETYKDWLVRTKQASIESTNEAHNYIQSMNDVIDVTRLGADESEFIAKILKDQEQETLRATQANYELVESYTNINFVASKTVEQINTMAESMRAHTEMVKRADEALARWQDRQAKGTGSKKASSIFDRAVAEGLIGSGAQIIRQTDSRLSTIEHHANGGLISEPTMMLGLRSGRVGLAGEAGSEEIIPHGRSGRGQTMHFHFEFDKKEFAHAIAKDVEVEISRIRRILMRITHEQIHGVG